MCACSANEAWDSCSSLVAAREALTFGATGSALLRLGYDQRAAVVRLTSASGAGSCSGTVVAASWVLTAAHCADLLTENDILYTTMHGCTLPLGHVARKVHHPSLDLLLVELDEPSSAMAPRPIEPNVVPDEAQDLLHSFVELAGYGLTDSNVSGELRFLVAEVVGIDASAITVDGPERSGACFGDSGGPLLQRCGGGAACVVGVLSRGSVTCGGMDSYIRVDAAREWLAEYLPAPAVVGSVSCGDVSAEGMCLGARAVHCGANGLVSAGCDNSEPCSWSDDAQGYRCSGEVGGCEHVTQLGLCAGEVALTCDAGRLVAQDCRAKNQRCLRAPPTAVAQCWHN